MNGTLTFDQLSATKEEDPLDYICMVCPTSGPSRPLYILEFYMGYRREGQFDVNCSHNYLSVRSSMKKLFEDSKWTLLPTVETMERLLKFLKTNLNCKKEWLWDRRVFYTDLFPVQEYEYEFYHLDLDAKITLVPSSGSPGCEFEPPYNGVPRFRSTVHPLLVLHYSTFLRAKSMIVGREMPDIVGDFTSMWPRVPISFGGMDIVFQDSSTDLQSNCAASWKPRLNWGRDLQTESWVRRHSTADPGASTRQVEQS